MILASYSVSFGRQVFLTGVTFSACILLMLLIGGCTESGEKDEILVEEEVITESTKDDETGTSFPSRWLIASSKAAKIGEVSKRRFEELASAEDPNNKLNEGDETETSFPTNWSIAPLTAAQIEEVSRCHVEEVAAERYPDNILIAGLPDAFNPVSACDWAVLAMAYAERSWEEDSLPEPAKEAFLEAISRNYGFAVTTPLVYIYFGEVSLVEAPPFVKQEITTIEIDYTWVGLGEPEKLSYSVRIEQAHTKPILFTTFMPETSALALRMRELDPDTVQALGPALTDLLPIESQFEFVVCTDNYPDWSITLTFKDGAQLELKTNGSNFLGFGGPWQTQIDNQNYVQFSSGFAEALGDLTDVLGLPHGSPFGMVCWGDTLFEKAFPD